MFQVGNVCCVLYLDGTCVLYQEGICVPGQEFNVFRGHCVLNLEGIMSSMSGPVFCIWKEYVSSIRNVRSSF